MPSQIGGPTPPVMQPMQGTGPVAQAPLAQPQKPPPPPTTAQLAVDGFGSAAQGLSGILAQQQGGGIPANLANAGAALQTAGAVGQLQSAQSPLLTPPQQANAAATALAGAPNPLAGAAQPELDPATMQAIQAGVFTPEEVQLLMAPGPGASTNAQAAQPAAGNANAAQGQGKVDVLPPFEPPKIEYPTVDPAGGM